jgi:alpha-glucosidase
LLAKGHEIEPFSAPSGLVEPDYSTARPGIHDIVAQLRALADEYGERLLIGEVYLPLERLVDFYGRNGSGVHLPFNFQLLLLPWQAPDIHRAIVRYEGYCPRARGQTGFWATMTSPGSRAASGRPRHGWQRCCC